LLWWVCTLQADPIAAEQLAAAGGAAAGSGSSSGSDKDEL